MKIRPGGAEISREDRRTDMTKLIVAVRNFANAPKNSPASFAMPVGLSATTRGPLHELFKSDFGDFYKKNALLHSDFGQLQLIIRDSFYE